MILRFLSSLTLVVALLVSPAWASDTLDAEVHGLQLAWAKANYQTSEDQKEEAFKALVTQAERLTVQYPNRAEPKVWEAIIRAGYAGAMGGMSSMFNAMPQMEAGLALLLEAEKINPMVLNGSVYTTLGSFYYMTPGGFVGFGDDDLALEYLNKAQEVAPNDMDANYFMGDYWMEQKKYKEAMPYLQKVIDLPAVEARPVYSEGRKAEAKAKLEKAERKVPKYLR